MQENKITDLKVTLTELIGTINNSGTQHDRKTIFLNQGLIFQPFLLLPNRH